MDNTIINTCIKCDKMALYNYKYRTNAKYCADHKTRSMQNKHAMKNTIEERVLINDDDRQISYFITKCKHPNCVFYTDFHTLNIGYCRDHSIDEKQKRCNICNYKIYDVLKLVPDNEQFYCFKHDNDKHYIISKNDEIMLLPQKKY